MFEDSNGLGGAQILQVIWNNVLLYSSFVLKVIKKELKKWEPPQFPAWLIDNIYGNITNEISVWSETNCAEQLFAWHDNCTICFVFLICFCVCFTSSLIHVQLHLSEYVYFIIHMPHALCVDSIYLWCSFLTFIND